MIFPVATKEPGTHASFAQAWGGGHEGTDIFAPLGAPVVAMFDGRIRHAVEPRGGKAVYLTRADGTQVYYAHLDDFAGGERLGPGVTRPVKMGELIGYVGTTGNAKGKAPHVHLEIRPRGGAKVDPYPILVSAGSGYPNVKAGPGWPSVPKASPATSSGLGLGLLLLGFLWSRGR